MEEGCSLSSAGTLGVASSLSKAYNDNPPRYEYHCQSSWCARHSGHESFTHVSARGYLGLVP